MLARCLLDERLVQQQRSERLVAENARLRDALTRSTALVQRAGRLASLGVLTAGFAHEIRSPLVALRVFAQLLPERWNDAEFRHEFAQLAVAEVDRVETLVRELLRIAQESPATTSDAPALPTSLPDAVEALLPLLHVQARGKGVEIVFQSRARAWVVAEPLRLRQVVMNLVLNAIAATQEGGSITLVCDRRDDADAGRAVLRVQDAGRRIANEDLPRVFEPSFTAREEGTGLDLTITREIVEASGGSIRAENANGCGTTFVVELPTVEHDA